MQWIDKRLRLYFEGSRVEVICQPGGNATSEVLIDGRKPSESQKLYGFSRAVTKPEGKWFVKWPVIAPIGSQAPVLIEDWTLAVTKDSQQENCFSFTLTGSKTGPDGEGRRSPIRDSKPSCNINERRRLNGT